MSQNTNAQLAQELGIKVLMLNVVRTQIAPGAPDEVIALYFHRCNRVGADPFGRQLYVARRRQKVNDQWEDRWMIETTIDGFRSIAESTGKYDGQDEPVYAYDKNGKIVSCSITVYRKDFNRGITATAFFSEYVQTKTDGTVTQMWQKMPHNQLAKCTEALALRKAFPRLLNGIYTDVEMEQATEVNVTPLPAATVAASATDESTETQLAPAAAATPIRRARKGERAETKGISRSQQALIIRRLTNSRSEKLDDLTDDEKAALKAMVVEASSTREQPTGVLADLNTKEASALIGHIIHIAA